MKSYLTLPAASALADTFLAFAATPLLSPRKTGLRHECISVEDFEERRQITYRLIETMVRVNSR